MPILNMVGGGKKGGNIGEPLNLTVITSRLNATITWEDNEIGTIPPTSFARSVLVRKVGSAPTSPSDGTVVVTETVKNTYKTSGYVDQGLTDETTYYYRVFSYSDLGGISYCDAVSVTPSAVWRPGANTWCYLPLTSDATDSSSNHNDGTATGTTFVTDGSITVASITNGQIELPSITLGGTKVFTISVWGKIVDGGSGWGGFVQIDKNGDYYMIRLNQYYAQNRVAFGFFYKSNSASTWTKEFNNTMSNRCHYVFVYDGTNQYYYINNTLMGTYSLNSTELTSDINRMGQGSTGERHVSKYIIETKVWTPQEVADYYDQTKGDYGIS